MKKVSLKKLKELRDFINQYLPNFTEEKIYITSYGKDIETKKDIYTISRYDEYAQRQGANWSYFLVMGRPRKQTE
jgi:hypothetical protein